MAELKDSKASDNTLANSDLVAWVRQAAPYIHAFRGRTFVIAFGGEVLEDSVAQALAQDFNLLASLGIRLVLVHGARPQIDAEMQRRGLKPHFHKGLRVTDGETLECVKSAMGVARIDIEALLSQGMPNTPMLAGNGGFKRGMPGLPSIDSMSAVSSPQM